MGNTINTNEMAEEKTTHAAERRIMKCIYKGEVDSDGLPHGKGEMSYIVERRSDDPFPEACNLCYKGDFVHGLRHGDGDLHTLGQITNPVSEYEWYSEGEYDGCGRLIRPSNPSGSWQRLVKCWFPSFEGLWENDMPKESRWEKGQPLDISEAHWKDIRRTSREALKGLTLTLKRTLI